MMITLLEWTLALSGILVMLLALWSFRDAYRERHALAWSKQNGALSAIARHHLICASTRVVAGVVSCGGGIWLLLLPNHADTASLVAKHAWLAYNWLLVVNLSVERWAAHKLDLAGLRGKT
jgi:hypothetical protein